VGRRKIIFQKDNDCKLRGGKLELVELGTWETDWKD